MPMSFSKTTGGDSYPNPFMGPIDHTIGLDVVLTGMTNKEIDAQGYFKAGIPLASDGTLCGAADTVYGVTIEPVKVAAGNAAGDISGAGTKEIAVALICVVVKDIGEDILDRAYTADEIAAFAKAGSLCKLVG